MPSRYATSKFRLLLLAMMLVAAVFVLAGTGGTGGTTLAQNAVPSAVPGAPNPQAAKGLISLIFQHIDPIFITIAVLSILGLTLIIQGFIQNRESVLIPAETVGRIREMIAGRQFKELMDFTETDPSFISKALNPALKRAPSFSAMKEAMETAIGEQTAEQFRKIEYLNIIGNLGPLLGLLGTVLGMIYAFQEVAATEGQANVGRLSYGISTALTHTFLGLFLAVPCLAAFGVLRTIVDRLTVRGALVAEELLLMIKPQEARTAGPVPGIAASAGAASGRSAAGVVVPPTPPPPVPGRKLPTPAPSPQL